MAEGRCERHHLHIDSGSATSLQASLESQQLGIFKRRVRPLTIMRGKHGGMDVFRAYSGPGACWRSVRWCMGAHAAHMNHAGCGLTRFCWTGRTNRIRIVLNDRLHRNRPISGRLHAVRKVFRRQRSVNVFYKQII